MFTAHRPYDLVRKRKKKVKKDKTLKHTRKTLYAIQTKDLD